MTDAADATEADDTDLQNSQRGLIAPLPASVSVFDGDRSVWDSQAFDCIDGEAPDTVIPSLWRQEGLNRTGGLFEVADGLYQVRSLDLATMSFIRGQTGWIVVDPLPTAETAAAGLALVREHLEDRPVTAVIYTHSHADHFGGVRGATSREELDAGSVRIVAPEGFTLEAVGGNVMAGTAMNRRATYMYGNLLPPSPTGMVGSGLGKTNSSGTFGLLEPTDLIGDGVDSIVLDGVEVQTPFTPDTEAPAEFVFFLPAWGALCMAEVVTHTLHSLYPLRGAQVRDALAWSKAIDAMRARWGTDTELIFASHHWPTWGNEACDALRQPAPPGSRCQGHPAAVPTEPVARGGRCRGATGSGRRDRRGRRPHFPRHARTPRRLRVLVRPRDALRPEVGATEVKPSPSKSTRAPGADAPATTADRGQEAAWMTHR